jgi:hypothetical protein
MKVSPMIVAKKVAVSEVPDVDDSTFSLEAVFTAASNAIATLDFEEARRNPHWER